MSSRQLRRLQNLVLAYTEPDDLLGEGEEEEEEAQTMQQQHRKNRGRRPKRADPLRADTERIPTAHHSDPGERLISSPAQKPEGSTGSSLQNAEMTTSSIKEFSPSANKMPKPKKKPARKQPQNTKGKARRPDKVAESTRNDDDKDIPQVEQDLLQKVMMCDIDYLDTRLERLRNFGPQSLEDIGDGRAAVRKKGTQPATSSAFSIFGPHPPIRMAPTPLATPNTLHWAPYDADGVELTVSEEGGKTSSIKYRIYQVAVGQSYHNADLARVECRERHGDINVLLHCLHGCYYHLPTLLELSRSFDLMGSSYRAHELADIVLYRIGRIFTAASFPISSTWRERELPMLAFNEPVFRGLFLGFHHAMRRGCTRAAFELSRLLLSLDRRDPSGALLVVDYAALRCKQWVWLLEVYQEFFAIEEAIQSKSFQHPNGKTVKDIAQRCAVLPGFSFSAALAAYLLDTEASREVNRKKSKTLSQLDRSVAAHSYMKNLPSCDTLLKRAVLRFPSAALALIEALGGFLSVISSAKLSDQMERKEKERVWDLVQCAEERQNAEAVEYPAMHRMVSHIAELFVARQLDFWKASGIAVVLGKVLLSPTEEKDKEGLLHLSDFSRLSVSTKMYLAITTDDITGAIPAIPRDALIPEDSEESDSDTRSTASAILETATDTDEEYPDP